MLASPIAPYAWLEDETPMWPRVAAPPDLVALDVEVTLSSESQFFADIADRGSVGGVFVQTDQRLAVGRRVGLLLSTPTGEVEALGVVQWTRAPAATTSAGLGVVLEPFEAREQVEAFCRLRARIDPAMAAHGGPVPTNEAREARRGGWPRAAHGGE